MLYDRPNEVRLVLARPTRGILPHLRLCIFANKNIGVGQNIAHILNENRIFFCEAVRAYTKFSWL